MTEQEPEWSEAHSYPISKDKGFRFVFPKEPTRDEAEYIFGVLELLKHQIYRGIEEREKQGLENETPPPS